MARRRRGAGEGSVYRRTSDRRWVGAMLVGQDPNGRARRRVVYGGTQGEVVDKLQRLQAAKLDGRLGDATRLKLGEFLDRWLEDVARTQLRAATYANYNGSVAKHIKPNLGGVLLAKLAPAHVQALLATLERDGKSAYVRETVYNVLRRALEDAVRWDLIPRNPAARVARPRRPRKQTLVLDVEQTRKLLETAKGDRLEALAVLAVMTGMRQGELLGLRGGDVDLKNGSLRVQQTLEQLGRPKPGDVKTHKSRRRIDLPVCAVQALEAHRRRLGAVPFSQTLVFVDTEGGPVRKSNLIRRWWRPLLDRAELPRIRFHDLRHTAATLLLGESVHPKIVQERLGHSQIGVTMDTYSHVLEGMQREATTKLDALLGG